MTKLAKIRLRSGKELYLDEEMHKRYTKYIEFCSKYLHKPRNEQFFMEYNKLFTQDASE